jgi:uncharacterized protein YwqG
MSKHEYAEGQRWTWKNPFEEFENTLVIEGIARLSLITPQPDRYHVRIRCSNSPKAIHSMTSVMLGLTEHNLDEAVLELIETNATIEPRQRELGLLGGDSIEHALTHFLEHERQRERGRELTSHAPTIDEVRAKLQPWIQQHTRPAWKPLVQKREISLHGSKFCGTPALVSGERWPICDVCKSPMPLFLQLNSHDLPPEFGQPFDGLLQLFYCVAEQCEGGSYEPFEGKKLLRVIRPPELSDPPQTPRALTAQFPGKSITGWKQLSDLPDGIEHEELGLAYHDDFSLHTVRIECPSLALTFDNLSADASEAIAKSLSGDKLGGWPNWVQGVEYPNCPRCSKRMHYLFQIDSEDNVPFMFGDVGTGHITQCKDHPEILAFAWACS